MNLVFNSNYSILNKIKKNNGWEFFLWVKIWNANNKNHFLNKILLKSLTKLFFHNYVRQKLKDRAGILAVAILVCNWQSKIKIERKITKMEIFTSLNANQFYKNINIEECNDEKYLESYNNFNNIKTTENVKKLYKINTLEKKMDFLREYIPIEKKEEPEEDSKNKNVKKVSDYFSK